MSVDVLWRAVDAAVHSLIRMEVLPVPAMARLYTCGKQWPGSILVVLVHHLVGGVRLPAGVFDEFICCCICKGSSRPGGHARQWCCCDALL